MALLQSHLITLLSFTSLLSINMSETIEHIVLLNVKPDVDSTKIATMLHEINGLAALTSHLSCGKILRSNSNFTHIVHCRFSSTDDLQVYNHHPEHMRVHENIQPISDYFLVVDWMSGGGVSKPLKPGYVMKVVLLKLKEGYEKSKLVEKIKSWSTKAEEISVGEALSYENTGKGYSFGLIAVYRDLEGIDSDEIAHKMLEVKDYIESEIVVDYVAPLP